MNNREIDNINWDNLDLNKLNWDKINVDEFLKSEKGMKATCDAVNKGYERYCKANGLDPDKPEEWPSNKK